jgi:hypothetical protein
MNSPETVAFTPLGPPYGFIHTHKLIGPGLSHDIGIGHLLFELCHPLVGHLGAWGHGL